MRVFITGAKGLLGTEVCKAFEAQGHEVIGLGREFDVTDPECTAKIAAQQFGTLDWVINCAAFTGVDAAESEPQSAYELNTLAAGYLSSVCSLVNVRLLHLSTDFVFDGEAEKPYLEEDETNPIGVYGRTKREGEKTLSGNHRAVVVRTSWLFGPNGKCFPRSILNAFDQGKPLRVVADQFGTPTYTPFLAKALLEVVRLDPFPGIYHLAGPDVMSWFELAENVIYTCRGERNQVTPIRTEEWPTPARRPRYSALSSATLISLGVAQMPSIDHALRHFCDSSHQRTVASEPLA